MEDGYVLQSDYEEDEIYVMAYEPDKSVPSYNITVTYGQSEARSMRDMINKFRTGSDAWYWASDDTSKVTCSGLSELTYDYNLEKIAMLRAAEIAVSFSHTRPDGTDCFSAVGEIGYSWNALGENIAYGWGSFNTAAEVMEAWKETNESYSGQGHRRNMLSGNFNRVAVGFAKYNGRNYWVQEFSYSTSPVSETTAVNGVKNVGVKVADSLAQRLNLKDEEAPSQPEDPTPSRPEEPTPSEPETPGTIYVPDENGNINYGRTN